MSDIEIARKAKKQNIKDIAAKLNLEESDLRPYGHYIAKINTKSILFSTPVIGISVPFSFI